MDIIFRDEFNCSTSSRAAARNNEGSPRWSMHNLLLFSPFFRPELPLLPRPSSRSRFDATRKAAGCDAGNFDILHEA